jgi:hypothetical protein
MADGLTFGQAAAFAGVTVKIPPGVVSAGEGTRLGRLPPRRGSILYVSLLE